MSNTTLTPTTAERPHAERSASQLGPLLFCPGYRPNKNSKVHWVTAQGQRGHDALDTGDEGDLESGFEERMVAACELYASKFVAPGDIVLNEIKVTTISGRWGYFDRLVIKTLANGRKRAILLDWKFVRAKKVADAEINLQGKDYVVGIFEDTEHPEFQGIDEIEVHFVMPRFEEVSFTREPFKRSDLPLLKLEIFSILARARQTDSKKYRGASLTPNYDVCKYCGAAGNCVALRKIADKIGRAYDPEGYGQSLPIPAETHASKVKDPVSRGQLQQLAGLMEVFAASVRHHNLEHSIGNPENLPAGYVLDWSKGKRKVISVDGLLLACAEFGIKPTDLLDHATLSFTGVEGLLKDKAPRGEKSHVVASFNQRCLELGAVDRNEATAKLARARPSRV